MSMYGESEYNRDKNNIYDEIRSFLEDHPMSEFLTKYVRNLKSV